MWRISNFEGGILNIPIVFKSQKDPIIDSIYKGTEVVEDEKTAEKSYERREERRKNEIAEIAASKKLSSNYKAKNTKQGSAGNTGSNFYKSPLRKSMSPSKMGDKGKHHHHHHDDDDQIYSKYPPPPVFNSLPPNLEFVHRLILKCTDPKFMEEKKTKKK